MPGFDRTGPEGEGSRTGRKKGNCRNPLPKEEVTNGEVPNASFTASRFGKGGGRKRRGRNR